MMENHQLVTSNRQLTPAEIDTDFTFTYDPPRFDATRAIETMHYSRRAGNTNNITVLVTGTKEEQDEYVQGLLVLSVLIGCLFLTWALILLFLKCCGKRVGCASGVPRQPNSVDNEEHDKEVKRGERCLKINRFIFVFSGLGAFVSIVVFLSYGVNSLQSSVDSVSNALNGMIDIVDQAENISQLFLESFNNTEQVSEEFDVDNFGICPALFDTPDNQLPEDLVVIKEGVEVVANYINNLSGSTVDAISGLQGNFQSVKTSLVTVDESLSSIEIAFVFALVLAGFQLAVVVVLTLGVILAWCNKLPTMLRWMQSYVFLPFFTVSILLSIALSAAFVVGSVAGSDFCYPTPDITVVAILEELKANMGSDILNIIVYYIYGCPSELNTLNLTDYTQLVITAVDSAHNLTYSLTDAGVSELSEYCGENATLIVNTADAIHGALHLFLESVSLTTQLFHCETFNSLYAYLAYDAVCIYGVDSLYGVYISQLMIAIFCMIMMTLRVSWQDIDKA